ncbi:insulinase family protein [Microbacterium sp. ASV81]|nr:insulinase family protein [Microbacterium sp. ASV81]
MATNDPPGSQWAFDLRTFASDRFRVGDVDGIPVVHGTVAGGDVFCALIFRVGFADETFATSGITHLIEHLALFGLDDPDVHANGQTQDYLTIFHFQGPLSAASRFLTNVASALRSLPMIRLDHEKEVLRTEWQGRAGHPALHQALERYGVRGPGLANAGEIGLHTIGDDDVRSWAARYFTRNNAIAVLTADALPDDLSIDLPRGDLRPIGPRTFAASELPGFFIGSQSGVLLDAEVPRSTAASFVAGIIQRILFRRLRTEQGISYHVAAEYAPIDADSARISITADVRPEHRDELVAGILQALSDLRGGVIDDADIEAERSRRLHAYDSDVSPGELVGMAVTAIQGRRLATIDELKQELRAVSRDDLIAASVQFWSGLLAQLPIEPPAEFGLTQTLQSSLESAYGEVHRLRNGSGEVLFVSPTGVSMEHRDGRLIAARYEETVGLLKYPDGGRRLVTADGFLVSIEPAVIPTFTTSHLATLDASIPSDRHIALPERAADQIPRLPAARRVPETVSGYGVWGDVTAIVLAIATAALIAIGSTFDRDSPWQALPAFTGLNVVVFVFRSRRVRLFWKALTARTEERRARRR